MPVFATSFLGARAHAVGAGTVLTGHRCSNRITTSHVGLNHAGGNPVIARVLRIYAGIRIQLLMCSGPFRWHGHMFDLPGVAHDNTAPNMQPGLPIPIFCCAGFPAADIYRLSVRVGGTASTNSVGGTASTDLDWWPSYPVSEISRAPTLVDARRHWSTPMLSGNTAALSDIGQAAPMYSLEYMCRWMHHVL